MKKLVFTIVITAFILISFSFFSEKVVEPKKIVLKEDLIVVEENVISEQTQLIQSMKEEVDELYDTTYKLNRLLIKDKQGDQDVRHTSTEPRASRSRITHRRGNGFNFAAEGER